MKNPKNKGNAFERCVAKMLTEWAGVKFLRTPSSGAIHNFKDKRVVSDIVAPLSIGNFPFSIECKNVSCSWEFSSFLEDTSVTINKHWNQCLNDAERENLIPLLVFTKNFHRIFGVLQESQFQKLDVKLESIFILSRKDKENLVIFSFSDLLKSISCNELIAKNLL